MNKTLTIVIATYNRFRFLERCLASVAAQTCKDFNVIVVNDHGKDVTDIVEKFRNDISNILLITLVKNIGFPGGVYNVGFKRAETPYVQMLADDDTIEAYHVETLVRAIAKVNNPKIVMHTQCALAYEDNCCNVIRTELRDVGDRNVFKFRTPTPDRLAITCDMSGMCVAIPKEYVDRRGGFDENLDTKEDWELWLRMVSDGYEFCFVPVHTANWHFHGDNLTFYAGRERNIKAVKYIFAKHFREDLVEARQEVIGHYGG